jgi:hypothetical protein
MGMAFVYEDDVLAGGALVKNLAEVGSSDARPENASEAEKKIPIRIPNSPWIKPTKLAGFEEAVVDIAGCSMDVEGLSVYSVFRGGSGEQTTHQSVRENWDMGKAMEQSPRKARNQYPEL